MSETSTRLALPYLAAGQAQKHVTVNEALGLLDAIIAASVLDRDATTPPISPDDGDCYLVATGATGLWGGWDGDLTIYQDGAWRRIAPTDGVIILVSDEGRLLLRQAGDWIGAEEALDVVSAAAAAAGALAELGVNTAADATNRFALKADAALLSHDDVTPGTGDLRVVINKESAGKAAELLFQTGFSSRAVLGLSGSDDFNVKVSADGSAWTTALSFNRTTGQLSMGKTVLSDSLEVGGDTWRNVQATVAATAAWAQFKGRRARGTQASPAAVQAGDTIYAFTPEAHDGSNYVQAGGFDFVVETNFATAKNAYWRLATLDAGSWSEKMRVKANGNVGVGLTAPATKLDVDGPVRAKSYTVAGAPSASSIAGAMIHVSNESGGAVLAFSDGTNWRRVTDRAIVS